VCIRRRVHSRKVEIETAVFQTFTQDLERMRDWLKQHKVKNVAMESTGVYWVPVWNVLEGARWKFELLLVNPQHVRALPGRKTDQQDADRLAELLQYGLLRGSFIPPQVIRELRGLTRRRVALQGERNRVINRVGGLLETANVKLGSVISNLVGVSGMAILEAMAAGKTDPEKLATYTTGRLQATHEQLVMALDGRYTDQFRWLLRDLLEEHRHLNEKVALLQQRMLDYLRPHQETLRRLCTIPGVDANTASALLAEIGTDMSQFPSSAHLASWAGVCPGNSESAGKRLSGRTRKGNRYLRRLLIQNAWAVSHMKDCYLTAVFYRIAGRQGVKKAAMAVAHRILVIAYYVIRDGVEYREQGGDFFDRRDPQKVAKRMAKRLERLGFSVVPNTEMGNSRRVGGKRTAPRPPISLEQAGGCPRCAKWGMACIHARNSRPLPPGDSSASDSQHST
jgi:transposase